jgi:hypothetical protein
MKNIHLMPTDNLSKLYKENGEFHFEEYPLETVNAGNQYIYITSDLEVKEGDLKVGEYYLYFNKIRQFKEIDNLNRAWKDYKKIILTTDQDLIADGVQAIDDTFLEWFVNNPSCEEVKVKLHEVSFVVTDNIYKIIIPKEEPKQKRMYSKENMINFA